MLPLPDGITQAGEGVHRCPGCSGEVIYGRTPAGEGVSLTPVLGDRHACQAWQDLLETLYGDEGGGDGRSTQFPICP